MGPELRAQSAEEGAGPGLLTYREEDAKKADVSSAVGPVGVPPFPAPCSPPAKAVSDLHWVTVGAGTGQPGFELCFLEGNRNLTMHLALCQALGYPR